MKNADFVPNYPDLPYNNKMKMVILTPKDLSNVSTVVYQYEFKIISQCQVLTQAINICVAEKRF